MIQRSAAAERREYSGVYMSLHSGKSSEICVLSGGSHLSSLILLHIAIELESIDENGKGGTRTSLRTITACRRRRQNDYVFIFHGQIVEPQARFERTSFFILVVELSTQTLLARLHSQ